MGARGRLGPDGRTMTGGYYRIAMAEGIKILLPSKGKNSRLPEMSHTSRVYATIYRSGDKAGMLKQLRIYGNDHYPVADIDFGHEAHHGLRGGDIHVHVFTRDRFGKPVRPKDGRSLNKFEKKKFAKIFTDKERRYL